MNASPIPTSFSAPSFKPASVATPYATAVPAAGDRVEISSLAGGSKLQAAEVGDAGHQVSRTVGASMLGLAVLGAGMFLMPSSAMAIPQQPQAGRSVLVQTGQPQGRPVRTGTGDDQHAAHRMPFRNGVHVKANGPVVMPPGRAPFDISAGTDNVVTIPGGGSINFNNGRFPVDLSGGNLSVTIPGRGAIQIIDPSGSSTPVTFPSGGAISIPTGPDVTIPNANISVTSGGVVVSFPQPGPIQIPDPNSGGISVNLPSGTSVTIPGGRITSGTSGGRITVSQPNGGEVTIPNGHIVVVFHPVGNQSQPGTNKVEAHSENIRRVKADTK